MIYYLYFNAAATCKCLSQLPTKKNGHIAFFRHFEYYTHYYPSWVYIPWQTWQLLKTQHFAGASFLDIAKHLGTRMVLVQENTPIPISTLLTAKYDEKEFLLLMGSKFCVVVEFTM